MINAVVSHFYGDGTVPFLSIVTRYHLTGDGRGDLLRANRKAVMGLADNDFEHVILVDRKGQGIDYANSMLNRYKRWVFGKYVYIVDDDDEITDPNLVGDLKAIVAAHKPDIIGVKYNHAFNKTVCPSGGAWQRRPIKGEQGTIAFVFSQKVYMQHIHAFGGGWGADYRFFTSVWQHMDGTKEPAYKIYYHDKIVARRNRQSAGR